MNKKLNIKMTKYILASLFVMVMLFGCKKNDNELAFIPGEILFTPEYNATFVSIFHLIDSLDLKIRELKNRNYTFIGANDSILALMSALESKDYLTSSGKTFSFIINDSIVEMNLTFYDVDDSDFNDWISTQSLYHLTEEFKVCIQKWSILDVPTGTEQDWVARIVSYDIIESASLHL